ncbi:MAG: alcohol dehydrogenase catalytic domain-containing protein [Gemmatimonadetes bacterium]|nr:alcohol dehydrogenase catalytic domain-containing protein [Gemmatimonadota bacterium]
MSNATMKAAVLVDVDRFEVRDVPRIPPAPHEVLVRVQAVGLCGTDIHIAAGHANHNADEHGRPRPLQEAPQILGHEIAGVVAECGSAVRDLRRATGWSWIRDVAA